MSEQPPAPVSPATGAQPPPPPGAAPAGAARAGFGSRLASALVDGIIFVVVGYLIGKAFGQDVITSKDGTFSYSLTGGAFLLSAAFNAAYLIVLEGGAAGQTIGKKLMGISVRGIADEGPIGYSRAAVRWIGRLASALPLFLGFLWMLWDKERQTWHDKFAQSVVVKTR